MGCVGMSSIISMTLYTLSNKKMSYIGIEEHLITGKDLMVGWCLLFPMPMLAGIESISCGMYAAAARLVLQRTFS